MLLNAMEILMGFPLKENAYTNVLVILLSMPIMSI